RRSRFPMTPILRRCRRPSSAADPRSPTRGMTMSSVDIAGLDLREALSDPGEWSTVYTDGPQGEPPGAVESRMRSLKDRMLEAGVPEEDADAVIAAVSEDRGLAAPSARWL